MGMSTQQTLTVCQIVTSPRRFHWEFMGSRVTTHLKIRTDRRILGSVPNGLSHDLETQADPRIPRQVKLVKFGAQKPGIWSPALHMPGCLSDPAMDPSGLMGRLQSSTCQRVSTSS